MNDPKIGFTRRNFLWRLLIVPPALIVAACNGRSPEYLLGRTGITTAPTIGPDDRAADVLAPTPACDDDDDPPPPQTAGPFYTPNSPERASLLEDGITGTRMLLTGTVLTTGCAPVAGALVDFWHADDAGVYDNAGYRLRGHQFTDANGRYSLETIVPGLYPGRTRHFHVRVQPANGAILTTQLYFPGEPANTRDGIYNSALEMAVQDAPDSSRTATFDFVLG